MSLEKRIGRMVVVPVLALGSLTSCQQESKEVIAAPENISIQPQTDEQKSDESIREKRRIWFYKGGVIINSTLGLEIEFSVDRLNYLHDIFALDLKPPSFRVMIIEEQAQNYEVVSVVDLLKEYRRRERSDLANKDHYSAFLNSRISFEFVRLGLNAKDGQNRYKIDPLAEELIRRELPVRRIHISNSLYDLAGIPIPR